MDGIEKFIPLLNHKSEVIKMAKSTPNNYRIARLMAGYTIPNAADRLPICESNISRIEHNTRTPLPFEIDAMAVTYNNEHLREWYCSEVCPCGRRQKEKRPLERPLKPKMIG